MDLKFSKVARKGPVTTVTLSRPEVYNALHIEAHFELNKVFDDFCADPEQWVAIVTGAGDKRRRRQGVLRRQRPEMAGGGRQARLGYRRICRADRAL
jgi:1,4-dihydroxy-2-naphthoyl-CoA synthase